MDIHKAAHGKPKGSNFLACEEHLAPIPPKYLYEDSCFVVSNRRPDTTRAAHAVRPAVICYNLAHKFVFDAGLLMEGTNKILSLPANATDYKSAVLPQSVYVQYDVLRLEVK